MPTLPFLQNYLLRAFIRMDPVNVLDKFEVRSGFNYTFLRYSIAVLGGVANPKWAKSCEKEAIIMGSGMIPFERALLSSYIALHGNW